MTKNESQSYSVYFTLHQLKISRYVFQDVLYANWRLKHLVWAKVAQGVSGRLKPRIFLTFRHYEGGRSSAKSTGRLYPRRNPWYSISKAESTSGHMVLSRKKSPVTPPGIDPWTSRLVAQCLNHYATPGPLFEQYNIPKVLTLFVMEGKLWRKMFTHCF